MRPSNIIIIISLILVVASAFSQFFLEMLASVAMFNIIYFLFWRQHHPPIIFLGLLLSLISISIGHFYCALTGTDIKDLLWRPYYSYDNIDKAFWYSIFGLFFLSLGIRMGVGKVLNKKLDLDETYSLNILKLMLLFVFYVPLTDFLFNFLRFKIPGASQFIYMLKLFRWSFFFLIVVAVFYRKELIGLFWGVLGYGIITSLASYFSTFKDYFFYFPIGYLSVKSLNLKQTIAIILLAIAIFLIGVYWSYIKNDYRLFLSGGQKAQIVVVSKKEAIRKFFSYVKYFDKQRFKLGQDAMIKRLFYLEYFSATIRFIPTYKPYMEGYNTKRALRHVLMPRFLFPNKPPLDDSRHTMELTGIYVASAQQATSISTGYTAEFYADYGPLWMHIPLFLLGLLWGWIYQFIIKSLKYSIWGFAMAVPMFIFFGSYGRDLTKILGDTLWFLATFILLRFTILKYVIQFFKLNPKPTLDKA